MSALEGIWENLVRTRWAGWQSGTFQHREMKAGFLLTSFRLLTLLVGAAQVYLFRTAFFAAIPFHFLFILAVIFTLVEMLHPLRWYLGNLPGFSFLTVDFLLCVWLVTATGGLYSPFLLYSLSPVLRAGMFLSYRRAILVALASSIYVLCGHVFNPFFSIRLDGVGAGYYFIYITAVSLCSVLPYLINVNLRRRLEAEDMLRERQRLSHELHDGCAQTISVMLWQVQLVQRRLEEIGIQLAEMKELEELAQRAHRETRDALKTLRGFRQKGNLIASLRGFLAELREEAHINFTLSLGAGQIQLDPEQQEELLYICREALTNIRRHSGARNVEIRIEPGRGRLRISIADDGHGFNIYDKYSTGYGLRVMRERTEALGGKFEVISAPGYGATVKIEIPGTGLAIAK